jgi:hypothetical protein
VQRSIAAGRSNYHIGNEVSVVRVFGTGGGLK